MIRLLVAAQAGHFCICFPFFSFSFYRGITGSSWFVVSRVVGGGGTRFGTKGGGGWNWLLFTWELSAPDTYLRMFAEIVRTYDMVLRQKRVALLVRGLLLRLPVYLCALCEAAAVDVAQER